MPWWLWALLAVAVVIALIVLFSFRAAKNPAGYMSRSQLRLKVAERLVDEVGESLLNQGSPPKNIMRIESKLFALTEAQSEERLPDPLMEDHREAYAQMLRFQWLKIQDIRVTGGQNLDEIAAAEEEFGMKTEIMARERFEKVEMLRTQLGMGPSPDD